MVNTSEISRWNVLPGPQTMTYVIIPSPDWIFDVPTDLADRWNEAIRNQTNIDSQLSRIRWGLSITSTIFVTLDPK